MAYAYCGLTSSSTEQHLCSAHKHFSEKQIIINLIQYNVPFETVESLTSLVVGLSCGNESSSVIGGVFRGE